MFKLKTRNARNQLQELPHKEIREETIKPKLIIKRK